MKMFRLLAGSIALLSITLAGCGGTSSPDFTPVLYSVAISYTAVPPAPAPSTPPAPATKYAVGDKLQFTATGLCTTPPGTKGTDADVVTRTDSNGNPVYLKPCDIKTGDVEWSSSDNNIATITPSGGLLTVVGPTASGATGSVTVTGKVKGQSGTDSVDTKTIETTPPALRTITIAPAGPTIAIGETQPFTVTGKKSDGSTATLVGSSIAWTATDLTGTSVATLSSPSGTSTIATGNSAGTSTIKASTTDGNGNPVSDSTVLTVSNASLNSIDLKLTPASKALPADTATSTHTQDYQLFGHYSDGTSRAVPNSKITWTIADTNGSSVATLDPAVSTDNKVTAHPVNIGLATIKATLTSPPASGFTGATFATGTLTVTDARCSTPLSNQNTPAASINAAKTGAFGGICLGCGVNTPEGAIDANAAGTPAVLNNTVALGLPSPTQISLTVNAGQLVAAGGKPGFIVNDPTGALLSANLLGSTIVLDTLDAAGNVLETNGTASYSPPGLLVNPLDLTLLGLGNGAGTVVALANPTTSAFSAIRITFIPGLVGALSSVDVSAACANTAASP